MSFALVPLRLPAFLDFMHTDFSVGAQVGGGPITIFLKYLLNYFQVPFPFVVIPPVLDVLGLSGGKFEADLLIRSSARLSCPVLHRQCDTPWLFLYNAPI